jgi:hypothetical protein
MMTEILPRDRIERMITTGTIPALSREWEFSRPEVYVQALGSSVGGDRGVPALDQTEKTRTRENPVNYNHWSYPLVSKIYRDAALRMIAAYPQAYLESITWTAHRFLEPTTDDLFLQPNRHPIRASARVWEKLETSPWMRVTALLAIVWAIPAAFRRQARPSERLFFAFAAGTILWITVFGILFEFGENNRFRYPAQALVFILILACLHRLFVWVQSRWERSPLLGE